jgi:hypothetical protein
VEFSERLSDATLSGYLLLYRTVLNFFILFGDVRYQSHPFLLEPLSRGSRLHYSYVSDPGVRTNGEIDVRSKPPRNSKCRLCHTGGLSS